MANTPGNLAALVAKWRAAEAAHKAASDLMATEGETSERYAAQGEAAEHAADLARSLASTVSLGPAVLQAHADMLEAAAVSLGDDAPTDDLLLRTVATELRQVVNWMRGTSRHPLTLAVEQAEHEADQHEGGDRVAFDAACAKIADAQAAVMRCPDLVPAVLDAQADFASSFIDGAGEVDALACKAFVRNTRALSRLVDRVYGSPVMDAAVRIGEARDEFERLDAEHSAMFTGPGGTDDGMSDAERRHIREHGEVVSRAAGRHWAWDEVLCAYPARDLDDAAVHVVRALDAVEQLKTLPHGSSDYVSAALTLPRLLWSALGVLDLAMVPEAFARFYLGSKVNPWTGERLYQTGGRDDD